MAIAARAADQQMKNTAMRSPVRCLLELTKLSSAGALDLRRAISHWDREQRSGIQQLLWIFVIEVNTGFVLESRPPKPAFPRTCLKKNRSHESHVTYGILISLRILSELQGGVACDGSNVALPRPRTAATRPVRFLCEPIGLLP
jgi:hypothetical protein